MVKRSQRQQKPKRRRPSTIEWLQASKNTSSHNMDDIAEQNKDLVMSTFIRAKANANANANANVTTTTTTTTTKDDSSPINILCIDGGGAKGWTIRAMYSALEEALSTTSEDDGGGEGEEMKEPLSNAFDLAAGTSVGGAGALILNLYPEYGDFATLGCEMLKDILDNNFKAQKFNKILSSGHVFVDTRHESYKKYLGTNMPLSSSSSSSCHQQEQRPTSSGGGLPVPHLRRGPKTFVVSSTKETKQQQDLRPSSSAPSLPLSPPPFYNSSPSRWSPSNFTKKKRTKKSAPPPPSPILKACLLRTYDKPSSHSGISPANGCSSIKMWEAAEATTAAPVAWKRTRARRRSVMRNLVQQQEQQQEGKRTTKEDENEITQQQGQQQGQQQEHILHAADGCLVANNPVRHALQEAALLFPGRPLGLVLSIGLGRHRNQIDTPDGDCDDLAKTVEKAGGKFVRLNSLIRKNMTSITTDPKILKQADADVIHYMKTSTEAQRAKHLVRECFKENLSIRGRYAKAIPTSLINKHECERETRRQLRTTTMATLP